MRKIYILCLCIFAIDSVADDVGLTWYDNGTTITGPSSCTVGGTFTPPTPPARPGYIFTGWVAHVRSATCGIEDLDRSINGYIQISKSIDKTRCLYFNTTDNYKNEDCNSGYFDDLSWGSWITVFSYGTLYGESTCCSRSGDYHGWSWSEPSSDWSATTSQVSSSGKRCWCRLVSYTPANGTQCIINPTPSTWILAYNDYASDSKCANDCTRQCSEIIRYNGAPGYRTALFRSVLQ